MHDNDTLHATIEQLTRLFYQYIFKKNTILAMMHRIPIVQHREKSHARVHDIKHCPISVASRSYQLKPRANHYNYMRKEK